MKDGFRVLVTGSRRWSDADLLRAVLDELRAAHPNLTVAHGACGTGADALADAWCRDRGVAVERFPANWTRHGRSAGPLRNGSMVAAGADVCVAFFAAGAGNSGTAGCARLAARAGIEVRPIRTHTDIRTERLATDA